MVRTRHMYRTQGGPPLVDPPERTRLQFDRDAVVAKLDTTWPPLNRHRPNDHSRGIQNVNNLCYQNSVLQTLLHLPPFLRWIRSHSITACPLPRHECLKCSLKLLARRYWGETDPTNNPITATSYNWNIAQISYGSRFVYGEQDDASLFYTWILQDMYINSDEKWKRQIDALYRYDFQITDTFANCNHVQRAENVDDGKMLILRVVQGNTTIEEAIDDYFQENTQQLCKSCSQHRMSNRTKEIIAAPKILCINLQIMNMGGKIMHPLNYPEFLDFTGRQINRNLPLLYQLSGVVSHGGRDGAGHYIASVRDRPRFQPQAQRYTCISDSQMQNFTAAQFLSNPQRPTGAIHRKNGYQVFMLMYERLDGAREMPRRVQKELKNLKEF